MIRFSLVASAAVVAFALSACAPASETPVLSEEETELLMTGGSRPHPLPNSRLFLG